MWPVDSAKISHMLIYYVEDDANIRELALYALRQSGYEACGFTGSDEFFSACRQQQPDLILLDIMLPEVDGLEILRMIRADADMQNIPIMMLTAKGTEFDTVTGLDAGADDYLAKPFGMMELVSRVNALLRRAAVSTTAYADVLRCGDVELDVSAHTVFAGGCPVTLTRKEFDLLRTLMENAGHVLTRSQLLEDVWGMSYVGETRTVDVHIQTLRQKLESAHEGGDDCIQTVRGVGYCAKEIDDKELV